MLRIAKLGLGGEGYYLQSVGLEPEGVWLGEGKAAAGLGELVEPAHMTALLEGRDPASGDLLGGARNRVKVTAFDLTFAAPNVPSSRYWRPDWLAGACASHRLRHMNT
jgi:TrwC relaxase